MTRVSRIQSALFAATVLLGSFVMLDVNAGAQQYGNCEDVSASWYWGNTYNCGPYSGDNSAISGMESTMNQYVQEYYWGSSAILYWWSRLTPFDQPGYCQAGWMVQ